MGEKLLMAREVKSAIDFGLETLEPLLISRTRSSRRKSRGGTPILDPDCDSPDSDVFECAISDLAVRRLDELQKQTHTVQEYRRVNFTDKNLEVKEELKIKGDYVIKGLGNQQRAIRKKIMLLESDRNKEQRNVGVISGHALNMMHESQHRNDASKTRNPLNLHDSLKRNRANRFDGLIHLDTRHHSREIYVRHQTHVAKVANHQDRLQMLEHQLTDITRRISRVIHLPREYRFLARECINATKNGLFVKFCPFRLVVVDGQSAG